MTKKQLRHLEEAAMATSSRKDSRRIRAYQELEEAGELLAQAATKGIYDSPHRWKPEDIDAPEVTVEEI